MEREIEETITENNIPNNKKKSSGSSSEYEEALSPAARLFHSPRFNCYIIAVIGCKISINPNIVIQGLKLTLLKHPRFSSKLVIDKKKFIGKTRWKKTTVNINDHVIVPQLDPNIELPDEFLENYTSNLTTVQMDISKPLWELHLLNIKTSDANSVAIFRIHHSIGDGMSLMSLLLACTRKTSDPDALPTIPNQTIKSLKDRSDNYKFSVIWSIFSSIWWFIVLIFNTLADIFVFFATILFLKDTKTPIKGDVGVENNTKRFVHRTVSLDDIKLVKNAMKTTINDVVLGVTQAGLSQYLNRRYGGNIQKDDKTTQNSNKIPNNIRLRSTILVNLRPTTGLQVLADMMAKESKVRWGNWIGYILIPFNISLRDDPLDYIRQAKATIDRKKHSLEAICTFTSAKLMVATFGIKLAASILHRGLSNTTLSFSNVVGPLEEISFYGHPIAYLAPSVYGHPQALTIHYQSYINKMTISIAVDPNVIQDPHQLCNDLEESLQIIKDSVFTKGLVRDVL